MWPFIKNCDVANKIKGALEWLQQISKSGIYYISATWCLLSQHTASITLLHKVSGTWQLPHVNPKQILQNNPYI
jgi:hypothetical protein